MNYYEHHLGDYMRDTAHLSMVEDSAYHRLLAAYYIRERPLPSDLRECQKLARATSKPEREAVDYVLREFFELREDGYHQHRADREIARFQDKQRKAKASAEARWSQRETHSEGNADASPNAMRTHESEIQVNGKKFDAAMQNNISCAPRQNSGESKNPSHVLSNINDLTYANAMRTHSEGNADGMHRAPVPSNQTPVDKTYELRSLSGKPDIAQNLSSEEDPPPSPETATLPGCKSGPVEVLEFLNKVSGRRYEPVPANLGPIKARLKEYGLVRLKAMVAIKAEQWKYDDDMNGYLRPATLFNATKCAQYIAEVPA